MKKINRQGWTLFILGLFLLSYFVPTWDFVRADTGGPEDSGETTAEGLSIFNNSTNNWNITNGDALFLNDSCILMDGNITLETISSLSLENCIINVTGWVFLGPECNLTLLNTTLNLWGYINMSTNSTLRVVNSTINFIPKCDGGGFIYANPDSSLFIQNGSLLRSSTEYNYNIIANLTRETEITDSEIRDCGFDSEKYPLESGGVMVWGGGVLVENAIFTDCYYGLILVDSLYPQVLGSSFACEWGVAGINVTGADVSGNTFSDLRTDIILWGVKNSQINGNDIDGQYNVSDEENVGMNFLYLQNSSVSFNTINDKAISGIDMSLSLDNVVEGNQIGGCGWGMNITTMCMRNTFQANTIDSSLGGFKVNNSKSNVLKDNMVVNNTIGGILGFDNQGQTYSNNTIDACSPGILLYQSSFTSLDNNTITNSSLEGLLALDMDNLTFNDNYLSNNFEDVCIHSSSDVVFMNNLLHGTGLVQNSSFLNMRAVAGTINLMNCTNLASMEVVGTSIVHTKWYLNIHVSNSFGVSLPGVNVLLEDKNGVEFINTTTSIYGDISLVEVIHSTQFGNASSTDYFSPHNLSVSYLNETVYREFYVNSSIFLEIELGVDHVLTDWDITDNIVIAHSSIDVWGNITIKKNGVLRMTDFELTLHVPGTGERSIVVEDGGQLILEGDANQKSLLGSSVTDGNHQFIFQVKGGGLLSMNNVRLSECGFDPLTVPEEQYSEDDMSVMGLFIESDLVDIQNCEFENDHVGLVFNSTLKTLPAVSTSLFRNCAGGIIVANSNLDFQSLSLYNLSEFGIVATSPVSDTSLTLNGLELSNIPGVGVVGWGAALDISSSRVRYTDLALYLVKGSEGHLDGCVLDENNVGLMVDSSNTTIWDSSIKNSGFRDIWALNDSNILLRDTLPIKYHIPSDDGSKIEETYSVTFVSVDGNSMKVPYVTVALEEYRETIPHTLESAQEFLTNEYGESAPVVLTRQEIFGNGAILHHYDITSSRSGFTTSFVPNVTFTNETPIWTVIMEDCLSPVVDAGENDWIYVGNTYEFDGSRTLDNVGVVNYTWAFNYSLNLVRIYGLHPIFEFGVAGEYTIKLTARDHRGNSASDTMVLTVIQLPHEDSILEVQGRVQATLHYINRGEIPQLDISILEEVEGMIAPSGMAPVGIYFEIALSGVDEADWSHLSVMVDYQGIDLQDITDENGLDLYVGVDERWQRADAFSGVNEAKGLLDANVSIIGTFAVLGPQDTSIPFIIGNLLVPTPGKTGVELDTDVVVQFNEDVTNINSDTFYLMSEALEIVTGAIVLDGTIARLVPGEDLEKGIQYIVTVSREVTDLSGNHIENNYSWTFTTVLPQDNFKLLEHFPLDEQENIGVDTTVGIVFTVPVDIDSAHSYVSVQPYLEFKLLLTNDGRTLLIIPKLAFEYGVNYTVEIGGLLESRDGEALGEKYIFQFTTEDKKGSSGITENEPKFEMDLYLGLLILLVLSVVVLLFLMYITLRKQMRPVNITEEILDRNTYCSNCGEDVEVSQKICPQCGTLLIPDSYELTCRGCSSPIEETDEKCPSCKLDLNKGSTAGKVKVEKTRELSSCPFCGARVVKDEGSCPECGKIWLTAKGKGSCDGCGAVVDEGEGFCPFCGDELFQTTIECSECGETISDEDSFCPGCGEEFEDELELAYLDVIDDE